MARQLRIEFPGAFYHVSSRGNEKKVIFKSQRDREAFLAYLASASERYGAVIHAYCLMTNHYHLLVETPAGNLSQIMRHINGAYTTYFNVKRKRAGHLFQGRYKAILVEADTYATTLTRYIHLNPVRARISATPQDFLWSSYCAYIGLISPPAWLKCGLILATFSPQLEDARQQYRQFVEDLLHREYASPLQETVASTLLGSETFIAGIKEDHLRERPADPHLPALKKIMGGITMKEIIAVVERAVGTDEPLTKKLSLLFCHRYSGAKLQEIGKHFQMRAAAVCQASRRIREQAEVDDRIKELVGKIERELGLLNV